MTSELDMKERLALYQARKLQETKKLNDQKISKDPNNANDPLKSQIISTERRERQSLSKSDNVHSNEGTHNYRIFV